MIIIIAILFGAFGGWPPQNYTPAGFDGPAHERPQVVKTIRGR